MSSKTAVVAKYKNNIYEPLSDFQDLQFENINQLDLDHPGANDGEYRERRDYIAGLAKKFRDDLHIRGTPLKLEFKSSTNPYRATNVRGSRNKS